MIKIVSVEAMRQIEAAADRAGTSYDQMMQNAGRATALRALLHAATFEQPRITVLIGPGNNGGDGLVAGRIIAEENPGAQVRFYLLKRRDDDDPNFQAVQEARLFIAYTEDDHDGRVLRNMVASADIILDALFGIGIQLPLRENAAKLLRTVNRILQERRDAVLETPSVNPAATDQVIRPPQPVILAVDCPSGLNCDTGEVDPNTVQADETITFIAAKPGLLEFPGAAQVGELFVSTIGVPQDLPELQREHAILVDSDRVRDLLPHRPADAHKGKFGKTLVIGGCENYSGAPALSARAAYRTGAGLVTIAAPTPIINRLAAGLLEVTWQPLEDDEGGLSSAVVPEILDQLGGYHALLLGPGWGQSAGTGRFLETLLESGKDQLPSLVVDADGLNFLSQSENWWEKLPSGTVITPHVGEMARLSGLSPQDILASRRTMARQKAAEWNVILLLKGAHTLIATPEGKLFTLPFKNDALATAGTGDVLAGIIAGLLSQGLKPEDAAVAGGYLHGLAGEYAVAKRSGRSIVAGDLVTQLGRVLHAIED